MTIATCSYKVGFYGGGTGNTKEGPAYNSLRFITRREADQYGLDLLMRWTMPSDYVVTLSSDRPTHKLDLATGRRIPL